METSASFEARSAPLPYPTTGMKQARKFLTLKRLVEDSVPQLGNRGPGVPGSFWRCAFVSTFR